MLRRVWSPSKGSSSQLAATCSFARVWRVAKVAQQERAQTRGFVSLPSYPALGRECLGVLLCSNVEQCTRMLEVAKVWLRSSIWAEICDRMESLKVCKLAWLARPVLAPLLPAPAFPNAQAP